MKKLTCVVLVLMIIMSCVSVTATATQANVLHFDANSAGWTNFKKIFCHIWEYGGDPFYSFGAKKELCTDVDGDGIWTYDLEAKNVVLDPEKIYVVIFSNENGKQTYNLLLHSSAIGDTAYCNGTLYENPVDSSKQVQAAFWAGIDCTILGPEMCVTSIGNVVGTCVPPIISKQGMLEQFLLNDLKNARTYSGKKDQQLIDDIASQLDLYVENVEEAIDNTGVIVEWSRFSSSLHFGGTTDKDSTGDQIATPDQLPYQKQFIEYCNGHTGSSYTGPLYYHYEDGKDEPSWFVARGRVGGSFCAVIYGVFDDYFLINSHIDGPSDFNWHIYIFEDDKFYAIEDIWEEGFADKEALFTEFLVPNGYADIVGDADCDDELSILDATEIQLQLAGLHEPEDRILGNHYGDHIYNRCDFDRDEEVSVLDATAIQMYLTGLY